MFVKFVKDDKVVQEVSISPEMIPFPTDTVVLEEGKFTVESREYDILDGTCTVILDQQITWTEHPQEYSDAMLAYRKRWNNTIDLSCEDFFKMKQFVQTGSKLQAVKHVKESAKCGLKEAKDFVDTYCDYVL
jgi:ribosomal protein L7/L12 C-terminal domain